jgi:prephenate dehydrogenase
LNPFEPDARCEAIVVGLGLIGGSFAARLRQIRPGWTLVGHDIDPAAAQRALDAGLVHRVEADRPAAMQGADVVILAPPVGAILEIVARLERELAGEAFVIDVGSTKSLIVEALGALPERIQSVGGHPMTGAVTAGVAGPDPALFEGRHFVLTPTRTTRPKTLTGATELVGQLGAVVSVMDPAEHDAAVALVSHLPYLMSIPLLRAVGETEPETRELAAGGFKSRVKGAGANIPMWWDILRTNRRAISEALGAYGEHLDQLRKLLDGGSDTELRELLARAAREAEEMGA